MKFRNCNNFIIWILIIGLRQCATLGQSGLCTFNISQPVPNICDGEHDSVYGCEIDRGCPNFDGGNCWCILIDNHNREYDGEMIMELVQNFVPDSLVREENRFHGAKSYVSFAVTPGINRILYQPSTSTDTKTELTSIKINNVEICKPTNNVPRVEMAARTAPKEEKNKYILYADCLHRNTYTDNSMKFCLNIRSEFMIEKRYSYHNQLYWCLHLNNDNFKLTSANHLHLEYSSQNRYFTWSPEDAYIKREVPGSTFHLGNQKTIITISEYHGELTNINSITIDNKPICTYFEQPQNAVIPTSTQFISTTTVAPIILPVRNDELSIPVNNLQTDGYSAFLPQNLIDINENCGVKTTKNPLISGGLHTNPGDWPWHAAIYKLQSARHRFFICGGTLIDRKTIITAAHCVLELDLTVIPERLTVELGRYDLTIPSESSKEYRVFNVIPHDGFDSDTFQNDIAIITLANYVQLTEYVNFICLPLPSTNLEGLVGMTAGWGRDYTSSSQSELKAVQLPVIDTIDCLESNRNFFKQYLTNTNFCAGNMNYTNVCQGDSGGGLVFKSEGKWFLGGITSLGVASKSVDNECDLKQYALFTDVTKYISWIKRNS